MGNKKNSLVVDWAPNQSLASRRAANQLTSHSTRSGVPLPDGDQSDGRQRQIKINPLNRAPSFHSLLIHTWASSLHVSSIYSIAENRSRITRREKYNNFIFFFIYFFLVPSARLKSSSVQLFDCFQQLIFSPLIRTTHTTQRRSAAAAAVEERSLIVAV